MYMYKRLAVFPQTATAYFKRPLLSYHMTQLPDVDKFLWV